MTTVAANALFIDTNILIYLTDPLSPWQTTAEAALDRARSGGQRLCISQQILREFLAAATRAALNGSNISKDDLLQNIAVFRATFDVLDDTPLVLDHLVDLIRTTVVAGRQIHDANIVATMLAHSVHRVLTHNTSDFERYGHLIEVVPLVP